MQHRQEKKVKTVAKPTHSGPRFRHRRNTKHLKFWNGQAYLNGAVLAALA